MKIWREICLYKQPSAHIGVQFFSLISSYSCSGTFCTPCWYVLDFWKIKLEKSSSLNWSFSLQKSISRLIFAGYTGSKNQVRNRLQIQFVELDFSKLIFQKSSTDQLGVSYTRVANSRPVYYCKNNLFPEWLHSK